MKRTILSILVPLLLFVSCSPPSPTVSTPESTPAATLTAVQPTEPPAEHRIGIRVVDGIGEFYDRQTGKKFIPRGNNFIRLGYQMTPQGETILCPCDAEGNSTPACLTIALPR